MDPAEVIYWREYMREPRGDARADRHAAQITQAIYTFMGAFAKGSKAVNLEDCILKFASDDNDGAETHKGQTMEQAMRTVAAIGAAFGKGARPFTRKVAEKVAEKAKAVDGTAN